MSKVSAGIALAALAVVLAGIVALSPATRTAMLVSLAPAAGAAPEGAEPVAMASHKAIYAFRMLGMGSGNGGLTDIRGQMFFEQADACDGWTSDHRFTSEYFFPEQPSKLNVSQYSSWEAKDGQLFQFNSERQEDGADAEQLRGAVERRSDGSARAVYARPPELGFDLPAGYYLPVAHTAELIRRARAGEKIFHAVLFDGTDAEGPVEVNAVITGPLSDSDRQAIAAQGKMIDARLLAAPAWRIRMAVFVLQPKAGEDGTTPSYEMEMILHDNGVVSEAVIDYQKFKVAQRLTALEALPAAQCQ